MRTESHLPSHKDACCGDDYSISCSSDYYWRRWQLPRRNQLLQRLLLLQQRLGRLLNIGDGGDHRAGHNPAVPCRPQKRPSTLSADTEATAAGDYEAVLTWVVGLRAKVPFRVLVLDGPPRLVVDFQH